MIRRKTTKAGEARYEVRMRGPDGREFSRTFRTKKEAVRFEAAQRTELAAGSWVDPAAGRITFGEWADDWLATAGLTWRVRTAEKHRLAIGVHWRPRFGRVPIRSITPEMVQRGVNELAASYSPSSVRTYYGTLRACLRFAVDRSVIARSPCQAIKLPAPSTDEKTVIAPGDLHRLADAVGPRWRAFIYLGGVVGLRFGEVGGLRLRDVDLSSGKVSVVQTLVEVGGQPSFGPPKSRASVRTIPCPAPLVAELTTHLEHRRITAPDDLLFVNRVGRPVRRSPFRLHVFGPATRKLGLDGLTFHGLRHSAATQWVAAGVDVRTVQAWLGHADPQLVLRLYAHASDTAGRQAAEVVSDTFWVQPPDSDDGQTDGSDR
jgi:integrase